VVRVGDVASVELGAQQYTASSHLNGIPSATLAIYQLPNSNALQIAHAVKAQMAQLSKSFPPGLKYQIVYDSTKFVTATISEIVRTLAITFVLVVGVVFLFLQDWRATLIPTFAIPVSLIGVFAVLYALGYSANTISLFAIVLAITLVVDDAIVVVENVSRNLEENPNLPIAEATERAMRQITGPVIATTLVLVAVFAPVGFLPGITGELYRQFAVTICVSVLISALNALTLSPALCGLILRPPKTARFRLFRWFNFGLDWTRGRYGCAVSWLSRRLALSYLGLAAVFVLAGLLFQELPTGFIPSEDQGYFFVNITLPDGASLERTEAVVEQVAELARKDPGIENTIELAGFSVVTSTNQANGGTVIAVLKPWAQRTSVRESATGIIAALTPRLNALPAASIAAFNPPAIPGIGKTGGFDFELEARAGQDVTDLAATARGMIFAANQDPDISGVFTSFSAAQPQIRLEVDRSQAEILGVQPSTIYSELQAHLGSQYVNEFNLQGQVFQVIVQDAAQYRGQVSDIQNLYVRSSAGAMVPLRSVVKVSTVLGPDVITRYDLYPSVEIFGQAGPGKSSGQAMAAMEKLAAQHLPSGYGYDWTSLSYQQLQAGNTATYALMFSLVFAYLFLVAQYESWSLPVSIILSVSSAALGALVALYLRGFPVDVYGQIGLVLLVGLAAKNAILIVEFAKTRLEAGESVRQAALDGAETRFRAVLMTAVAFILGVVPLVVASGAGAGARQSIGTTVFGGMILATLLGIVFVPVMFVAFEMLAQTAPRLVRARREKAARAGE
jgi:multidrug efflux pump